MKSYCMECLQVNNAITRLVDKFWKKYYNEYKLEWVERREEDLHYNFKMNDDYWNIDEVYAALWYNIPEKILFKYLDERLDKAFKSEPMINLKNYFKIFKNVPWTNQS